MDPTTWLLILCTTANCTMAEKEKRVWMHPVTEKQCHAVVANWNKYHTYSYCVGPDGQYHVKPWLKVEPAPHKGRVL